MKKTLLIILFFIATSSVHSVNQLEIIKYDNWDFYEIQYAIDTITAKNIKKNPLVNALYQGKNRLYMRMNSKEGYLLCKYDFDKHSYDTITTPHFAYSYGACIENDDEDLLFIPKIYNDYPIHKYIHAKDTIINLAEKLYPDTIKYNDKPVKHDSSMYFPQGIKLYELKDDTVKTYCTRDWDFLPQSSYIGFRELCFMNQYAIIHNLYGIAGEDSLVFVNLANPDDHKTYDIYDSEIPDSLTILDYKAFENELFCLFTTNYTASSSYKHMYIFKNEQFERLQIPYLDSMDNEKYLIHEFIILENGNLAISVNIDREPGEINADLPIDSQILIIDRNGSLIEKHLSPEIRSTYNHEISRVISLADMFERNGYLFMRSLGDTHNGFFRSCVFCNAVFKLINEFPYT